MCCGIASKAIIRTAVSHIKSLTQVLNILLLIQLAVMHLESQWKGVQRTGTPVTCKGDLARGFRLAQPKPLYLFEE